MHICFPLPLRAQVQMEFDVTRGAIELEGYCSSVVGQRKLTLIVTRFCELCTFKIVQTNTTIKCEPWAAARRKWKQRCLLGFVLWVRNNGDYWIIQCQQQGYDEAFLQNFGISLLNFTLKLQILKVLFPKIECWTIFTSMVILHLTNITQGGGEGEGEGGGGGMYA